MHFSAIRSAATLLTLAALASATPVTMEEHCAKQHGSSSNNSSSSNNDSSSSSGAAGPAPSLIPPPAPPSSLPKGAFTLSLTNVMPTDRQIFAYCSGKDVSTGQLAWLAAAGNSFYHPTTSSLTPTEIDQSAVAIPLGPQGSTTQVIVPGFLNSARIYLSVGPMKQAFVGTGGGSFGQVQSDVGNPADPNNGVDWGFVEFNWEEAGGLFADISAVDHVGIPLGIELETTDGKAAQRALGLSSTSVEDVCAGLRAQAKVDSRPWDRLCVEGEDGGVLRVIGPQHLHPEAGASTGGFEGYFSAYVDKVWATYAAGKQTLTFDLSKQGYGEVACQVDGSGLLKCGSEPPFAKPNDADIFGCASGPFAVPAGASGCYKSIIPMLCAGFQRGTLLSPPPAAAQSSRVSGAFQPSLPVSEYYKGSGPFNWYSKVAHDNEWKGKGYAFPYDDVDSMSGEAVAGTAMTGATTVKQLKVIVGGYDRMQMYGMQ